MPVSPWALAETNHIKLLSFGDFKQRQPSFIPSASLKAFSFIDDLTATIVYDNTSAVSPDLQRWVLAHELSHIWLDHLCDDHILSAHDRQEEAADLLAADILCPLPVLHLCGIETAGQIAALCGIPLNVAQAQMRLLSIARQKNLLLKAEPEKQIANLFLPFISDTIVRQIATRKKQNRYFLPNIYRGDHP